MTMSAEQRDLLYLSVGGLFVVGLFAASAAKARPKKKSTFAGVVFNQDCSHWRVLDGTRLEKTLKHAYQTAVDAGETSPWAISNKQLRRIAPHCRRHPQEPRSVGEALLNYNLYRDNVDMLEIDGLISSEQAESLHADGVLWAGYYGVPKEHLHGYQEE